MVMPLANKMHHEPFSAILITSNKHLPRNPWEWSFCKIAKTIDNGCNEIQKLIDFFEPGSLATILFMMKFLEIPSCCAVQHRMKSKISKLKAQMKAHTKCQGSAGNLSGHDTLRSLVQVPLRHFLSCISHYL